MRVQQLPDGRLDHELGKVTQPRTPPIPVIVWLHVDGAEHEALLHGWAANPNGADDGWRGLCVGAREYAAGYWTGFCMWVPAEKVREA